MPGDGTRILVTTDRISAFDWVLGRLPYKGQILNRSWARTRKGLYATRVSEIAKAAGVADGTI